MWREKWILDGHCPFIAVGMSITGDVRSKLISFPLVAVLGRLGGTIKCSRGYADNS